MCWSRSWPTPTTAVRSSATRPHTCWPRQSRQEFPQARLGIGPPITDGFYYDFDVPEPFTPDVLAVLEKRMQQIVRERQTFSRRVVSDDEARAELADEPYKLELIGLKGSQADGVTQRAPAQRSDPVN